MISLLLVPYVFSVHQCSKFYDSKSCKTLSRVGSGNNWNLCHRPTELSSDKYTDTRSLKIPGMLQNSKFEMLSKLLKPAKCKHEFAITGQIKPSS
jgi:hypothetical protein